MTGSEALEAFGGRERAAASPSSPAPVSVAALGTRAALAAVAVLGTMVAIGFATGVAQEPMQFIGSDFARVLGTRPALFRTVVGLDNAFIAFYAAAFVLVHQWMRARGAPRGLAAFALACMMAVAALDLTENVHYLVMSRRVEAGMGVVEWLAELQVYVSWLKFHVGYVGLTALGLAFPRRSMAERALAASLTWVQLPIGIAIYVLPHAIGAPLVLVRAFFFLGGLAGTAYVLAAKEPA
jgi:hypothetical protein